MNQNTGELILASSDKCSNIVYASGFRAPDPFIYYSTPIEKAVVVSKLEFGRAESEVKPGVKVFEFGDYSMEKEPSPARKDILLVIAAKFPNLRWRVPADFPFMEARALESAGTLLECVDDPFFPERKVKTDAEIAEIIKAQRLAEKGMAAAAEMLKTAKIAADGTISDTDGETLTSERLRYIIDSEILLNGGRSTDTIVSCGAQASEPHNLGSGPLSAGKTIVIDIFPKGPDGYHGDLTRTFLVGTPPKIVSDAYNAVRKARDESKKLLKAGAIPAEVHKAAAEILRTKGFETTCENSRNRGFFHGLGHGLGLDIHEEPSLNLRNSQPLKAGEVVTVEPGLYYPEWGGVRLEDVIVIRDDGCETLTDCPTSGLSL